MTMDHRPPRPPRAPRGAAPPRRPARRPWVLLICGVGLAVGIVAVLATILGLPDPARRAGGLRAVTACRGTPQFAPGYGFRGGVILSTSLPQRMGLVLLDPAQPGKAFQHPSWTQAGHLGAVTTDAAGNIYVGPAPRVSLATNPPAGATTIWRVDTRTAEMTPFLTVPAAAPPSPRNPFGILGLAYDCDTGSLYAASVAGSAPASEVGRIVQIDPDAGAVLSQVEGIDALGIVIAATPTGKRLYYGSAREPRIASLALDATGAPRGAPRPEIDLTDLGADIQERARRIDILPDGSLQVTVIRFRFTLEPTQPRQLHARYEAAGQRWVPGPAPAAPARSIRPCRPTPSVRRPGRRGRRGGAADRAAAWRCGGAPRPRAPPQLLVVAVRMGGAAAPRLRRIGGIAPDHRRGARGERDRSSARAGGRPGGAARQPGPGRRWGWTDPRPRRPA